ncbi:murein biosynthesis integral membrane protein MurJ [Arthrobacter tecti]
MARPGGRSISRAAVLVTGLTAVSTLLGFLRDVVIAAIFGAGAQLDAYLVAQGLMNIVLGLVAYAMARSATPVVAREATTEENGCRGHTGFNVAFTVTMLILGVGSVIMGIFAAPVTSLIAPGFDAGEAATVTMLTRIILIATVLVAGTDLLAALAQSHGRFAWASLQGVPFNLIMIAAAGLFGPQYGVSALAVGFVVGSAARLLLQLPPLRSIGTRVRPRLALKDPGFREIAVLVPPMLVGSAIGNINTLVDRAVGSTLEEGAITALSYGWRLVNLPEQLLIASLLVPLYPAISASVGNLPELKRLVNRGLSVTVTILVPLCVVLAIAAVPLVEVAFGRGAFSREDIEDTATAVAWYAPALLALGFRQVVVSTSYALGDSKAPVVVAVVAMIVNIVGDILLAPIMGVAGIALATSASLVTAALANAWLLHRRHDGVDLRTAVALLLRAAVLAAIAAGVGLLLVDVVDGPALLTCAVVAVAVCGAYALGLIALRAPERSVPLDMIRAARRR